MLFSFLAFFAGKIIAQNIHSIEVGTAAPNQEHEMLDVSGKKVSIKTSMGKQGLLIMFSCNTCPYVIKNQERTDAIAAYAKQNGYGILIINSNEGKRSDDDSFEAMKEYAKKQKYIGFYTLDKNSTMANAFGATRTPEVFLLDVEGIVVYKGAIDDNPADAKAVKREHLKIAMSELKEGKQISVKESKSVGCSIKRVEAAEN